MTALARQLAVAVCAAAVSVAAALTLPIAGASAAGVPWGTGCMPTPEGLVRTSENCGAELVDGRAIAPPGAPLGP
jgi:hypothetical protein